NQRIEFKLNDEYRISADTSESEYVLETDVDKDESYPIKITFYNPGSHAHVGSFSIKWGWEGQSKTEVPSGKLYHTSKEEEKFSFIEDIDPKSVDKSQFIYPKVENVVVYYEKGRFAAFPANSGIWNWGNEILVGFLHAYNKENKYHHAIDLTKPSHPALARSTDGGESWSNEDPSIYFENKKKRKLTKKMNFMHPGFALRFIGNRFFFSYDKGKSWKGPYLYQNFGFRRLSSRTDYIVDSEDECFVFISCKDKKVRGSLKDRAMSTKTTNGGLDFEFVGWMSELDSIRSVMPATVRINENHLVSAMRRRLNPPRIKKYEFPQNWIDVYESQDNGKTWQFLSKIANTDRGKRNGDSPSMVKLKNGLLCVVYGYRGIPYSIRAKVSADNGKTWSKEIILRDDARIWDIGYSRSVVRDDDKVVSIYYYSTEERTERHIAATIWDPTKINN
ncbi:sialidase family protein, partial [Bacteroidota bacterium]